MADRFALDPHHVALLADMAVGVDLHLGAAIGEDALGHHGDHVDAFDLLGNDKGGGLVIGIGGAGADGGDKPALALDDVTVPVTGLVTLQERHQFLGCRLDHRQRIEPHQSAAVIGIAVAGPGLAIGDIAHHRAGIAADLFLSDTAFSHLSPPPMPPSAAPVSPAGGASVTPVASRIALRIAGAVGISTCSPSPLAP